MTTPRYDGAQSRLWDLVTITSQGLAIPINEEEPQKRKEGDLIENLIHLLLLVLGRQDPKFLNAAVSELTGQQLAESLVGMQHKRQAAPPRSTCQGGNGARISDAFIDAQMDYNLFVSPRRVQNVIVSEMAILQKPSTFCGALMENPRT